MTARIVTTGVLAVSCGACSCFGEDAAGAGKARSASNRGVLMFHGGRPWTATETASALKKAGVTNLTVIDSTGLDGLGGASIKRFLTDQVEPTPDDKITPAFAQLDRYTTVVIGAIPRQLQEALLTPDRMAQLREFVEHGGALVVGSEVSASLEPLLPVTFTGQAERQHKGKCIASSPVFAGLPEQWPRFTGTREPAAKPGSDVLACNMNDDDGARSPFVAATRLGKGKVVYVNTSWARQSGYRQFRSWVYWGDVLGRILIYANGDEADTAKVSAAGRRFDPPPANPINQCRVSLETPEFSETTDAFDDATIRDVGRQINIQFANHTKLLFDKESLAANISFAGLDQPAALGLRPPQIISAMEAEYRNFDQSTAEAVLTKETELSVTDLQLKFGKANPLPGGGISLVLKSAQMPDFSMAWEFSPKDLQIAGRNYSGIGQNVSIQGLHGKTVGFKFRSHVLLGKQVTGHEAWCMSCYTPPRGFKQVSFTQETAGEARGGAGFGSGQPFNWLVGPAGVYCDFLDLPGVNEAKFSHRPDEPFVTLDNKRIVGRVAGRAASGWTWLLYSNGRPATPGAWLGMYQYLRQRYCSNARIAPTRPLPTATHVNTCTEAEIEASMDTAKALGFVRYKLPLCPSSVESLVSAKVKRWYRKILARGLEPTVWSAGGYTQGMDNPVAAAHPEWLVYDLDGEVMQYGGGHPVFDFNSPGYMAHYTALMEEAIAAGMKNIYLDMGGAQTGVVNQRGDAAKPNLVGAIEAYRFFRARGVGVSIEGMTPLAMDEFWFRKDKYINHTGKEFAFVGMGCSANAGDHLAMDYFRLGMYGAFFDTPVSAYAFGLESVPDELELIAQIGKLNVMFRTALSLPI